MDHVDTVQLIFERFDEFNVTLNSPKCEFGQVEISYLGVVVNLEGIYLTAERTDAIRNFPVPQSKRQLQRFIGMANWCRRFVKDFNKIAKPLYEIAKPTAPPDSKFVMGDEGLAAFRALQRCMSKIGVMKLFEFGKPTVVQTDASKDGLGAVLLQEDNEGRLRVVEYASRKSNKAELNYPSQEMEALAVV